jgi:hypothetical protein
LQVGFFGKDALSFTIVQMGFATLALAAVVTLIVFWQTADRVLAVSLENLT